MSSPSLARSSQRSDRRVLSSTSSSSFSSGKKSTAARIAAAAAAAPRLLIEDDNADSGRVRVAVRVRPKNDEDIYYDSEFTDCLELQPELRRLKLKKNNWSSESYQFDDVFTESASQKRVYEAVAKPVVEAMKVLNVVKLKEECDFENKYRKLQCQIDNLTSEVERYHKDKLQLERRLYERELSLAEAEKKLVEAEKKLAQAEEEPAATFEGQVEDATYQVTLPFNEMRKLEVERSRLLNVEKELIELLNYGTRKFVEATNKINLMIELENHQSAVANPRARAMVIWFALLPIALFPLYFLR